VRTHGRRYGAKKTQIPRRGRAVSGRRYYSPSQGRFPSRDPIEEKGGQNLYAIVWNNPINKWDYLGMCGGPGEAPCQMPAFTVTANRIPSGTTYTTGLEFGATGFDYGYGPSN
jgi:RHS repeat-associated protein